jgi:TupA-like ATPgrasp
MDIRPLVLKAIYKLPMRTRRRALFVCFNRRLPHLKDPSSFNDKVNWRILHDRRAVLEWTCDKLAMKERASRVGGLHVPRTFWTGTDPRELARIELPEHWVFKPNHRCGLVHFGSGRPDTAQLSAIADAWLRSPLWTESGEWAYSRARSVLLVEETIGTPGSPPPDYKFFVFAGKVKAVQVDTDRHTGHRRRIYLPDWSPLEVISGVHELAPLEPAPVHLERMLAIAEELGAEFDFIQVDLYNIDGQIFFGEFSPYPGSGLDRFIPASFDVELGTLWSLPPLTAATA